MVKNRRFFFWSGKWIRKDKLPQFGIDYRKSLQMRRRYCLWRSLAAA